MQRTTSTDQMPLRVRRKSSLKLTPQQLTQQLRFLKKQISFNSSLQDFDASSIFSIGLGAPGRHLTKDSVRAFLVDYHDDFHSLSSKPPECWNAFYERNCAPSFKLIQANGNVVDARGLVDMYTSGEVNCHRWALVSVDAIQILAGGVVAVATYTVDEWYDYNGKYNADRSVYSNVIEEILGEPRIVQITQSIGQPIPTESRWTCSSSTAFAKRSSSTTNLTDKQVEQASCLPVRRGSQSSDVSSDWSISGGHDLLEPFLEAARTA
jgi:hypothetical protein